jgi:hypothetical protein
MTKFGTLLVFKMNANLDAESNKKHEEIQRLILVYPTKTACEQKC